MISRHHLTMLFLTTITLSLFLSALHAAADAGRALRATSTHDDCIFHGQYHQDEFLERNLFRGKRGGLYIDLGAYHPTDLSSTAYFDRCLHWSGLCVDANQDRIAAFRTPGAHRTCEPIHACLTDPAVHSSRIPNHDAEDRLSDTFGNPVRCVPIAQLLRNRNIRHVDFLSIDIEGHEWPLLRSWNFSEVHVSAIAVETWHGNRTEITDYLEDLGFRHTTNLGADDIFLWHGRPWLPAGLPALRTAVRQASAMRESVD
jgi:hypothetical protein